MKKQNKKKILKVRLIAIAILGITVALTGALFAIKSFENGNLLGGIMGVIIALIIASFAFFVYKRGSKDIREGYPIKDERSQKIMLKASSMAFYVSLYLLLVVGFLSDDLIKFRDVSQATGISVGLMALIFGIFWIYYSKKEI